jgi:hypothetical protein
MKNKLHGICIRRGWYREVYKGHFDFGRTFFGTYFLIGDYAPLTLQKCIDLEVGYDQTTNTSLLSQVIKDNELPGTFNWGVGCEREEL